MELLGHEPNKEYGALHYGGEWPDNVQTDTFYVLSQGNFSDDLHVFTFEWDSTAFRWDVDGVHYQTQTESYTKNDEYPSPFGQYFHFQSDGLINLKINNESWNCIVN